jgi:prevent-host-death family protein
MKIAPLAEVKARLSAYVDECETNGPVVITRNGKPVAILLAPTDDDDLENIILARSARFQALLAQSR